MKTEKKSIHSNSKRLSTVIFIAVILITVVGGVVLMNQKQQQIKQLNSDNTQLGSVLSERDSVVNALISTFDSIEGNLTFINERRSQLVLENSETNRSQNESILKDIKMMNTMLEESSKEIEALEKKLKDSGFQVKSFRNKIASLNKSIEQQNNQIVDLQLHVEEQNMRLAMVTHQKDSLQNEVISFRDSINQKDEFLVQKEEIIMQKVNQINKGFFASGTYKELFENGVVLKEGGFLGIGKNKIMKDNLNEDYFTQVDIFENRIIPLNAKKVNLISEHPSNSYKLIEEDGLITQLEIEIPEDFWKITHYAVIEVK